MPFYSFSSGKKIKDFFFTMNSVPSIGSLIEIEGVEWIRLASIPNYAIDEIGKINIDDPKDFVRRTANHKGNLGQLFDLSKELSDQRESRDGVDKIGENYKKERDLKMEQRRARNKARKTKEIKIKES